MEKEIFANFVCANYSEFMRNVVMSMGIQRDDANDIVQDVLIKLFAAQGKINRFDPTRGALEPWLRKLAKNQALDWMRSHHRIVCVDQEEWFARTVDDRIIDPMMSIENTEIRNVITTAVKKLCQNTRLGSTSAEIIILSVIEGMTPAEISRKLGISISAIHTARHRYIPKLANEIRNLLN